MNGMPYRNDDSDKSQKKTVSDANGKFVFDKVPAGNYKVALCHLLVLKGILNQYTVQGGKSTHWI
jgi:hypothetical protein